MTEAEWIACTDPQPMLEFLRGKASERKLRLFIACCCRRVSHLMPATLLQDAAGREAVEIVEAWPDNLSKAGEYSRTFGAVLTAAKCEWRLYEDPVLASTLHLPLPALLVLAVALRPRSDLTGHLWNALTEADVLGGEEETDLVQQALGVSQYSADALMEEAVGIARVPKGLVARLFRPKSGHGNFDSVQFRNDELCQQADFLRCVFGNPFRPITLSPSWRTGTVTSLAEAIYAERAFDRLPVLADALEEAGCTDTDILEHCRGLGLHTRGCHALDTLLGKE